MGERHGWGRDCTSETAWGQRNGLGDSKRAGQTSIRRILGGCHVALASGAQDSGVIQIENPETLISRAGLECKRADRSGGIDGPRGGLDLVIHALGKLRSQAWELGKPFKLS